MNKQTIKKILYFVPNFPLSFLSIAIAILQCYNGKMCYFINSYGNETNVLI